MEDSSSSKDVTKETPTPAPAVYRPCFPLDTLRAIFLKCLGIEIRPHQSCPSSPQPEAASSSSSSSGDQNVDPSSTDPPTTTLDTQADTPYGVNPTAFESAAPTRPIIEGGNGPQTN